MIQNIERSKIDGSIECFRVHDLLLELAIQEAKQKKFLTIFSKQADFENASDTRRAAFQLGDSRWEGDSFEQNKMIEYTKPNVRTLIFFGKMVPFDSQFKLLKVLMVKDCYFSFKQNSNLKKSLKRLLHLRCLVFKNCSFVNLEEFGFCLPTDHLHNLQTLDLEGSYGIVVSTSLLGTKTLRHVCSANLGGDPDLLGLAERDFEIESFMDSLGMESIPGLDLPKRPSRRPGLAPADLPYIQTLDELQIHNTEGIELLNMPNLSRFALRNRTNYWESIRALIGKLVRLASLKIVAVKNDLPLGILDRKSFSSHERLRSLHLKGSWRLEDVTLNTDLFPPRITELILYGSNVNQDLMPILEKLQCLKILVIGFSAYTGSKMICSGGGFPELQKLTIKWLSELEEWKIEEGAMPMLNHLKIKHCEMLEVVPDLQHVPTLNVLKLGQMSEEFNLGVQNEEHKIKHITSITIA